jgi:hypothetical protein
VERRREALADGVYVAGRAGLRLDGFAAVAGVIAGGVKELSDLRAGRDVRAPHDGLAARHSGEQRGGHAHATQIP